ncbi:MAG: HlyC/CorC family transporter [Chromatiales bacterium]|nr:HlyC/CorC family transporter [Chromatiales bacterium]
MDIALLLGLILLNGLFAMSEFALTTARRGHLTRLAEAGDVAAARALALGADRTRFLSTVQIGITAIGVLSGIVGEAAMAGTIAGWAEQVGIGAEQADVLATGLVVALVTYVAIVVGELVPKRLAQYQPEAIARRVARPIQALSAVARPFVWLLSVSTDGVLRVLGRDPTAVPVVTEEEIHAILAEGSEAGVIEHQEHAMVRNLFRLDERLLGSLMVPRGDIVYLDLEQPLADNVRIAVESNHSRFPLCRGGLRDVVGTVHAKDLLRLCAAVEPVDLAALAQTQAFVPETLTGLELLQHFRASATQLTLVLDEYGEVEGLVTLQDVLEAVTGEFTRHHMAESWAVQREDGSWLLDGLAPMPELKDLLGLRSGPDEASGRYHTLSGMLMWLLGRIPHTGDVTVWEGWRFEVLDLDGRRIDKVLATRQPAPAAGGSDESAPP